MNSPTPETFASLHERSLKDTSVPPSPLLLGLVVLIVLAIGFSPWWIVKMARETPATPPSTAADLSKPDHFGINSKWHHSHLMQNQFNYVNQQQLAAQMQRERKFGKAVQYYSRLIEESSVHRSGNLTARGTAYLSLGRNDLAIADFNNAISLDPVDADAYKGRAEAFRALGQMSRSEADIIKSMKLNQ